MTDFAKVDVKEIQSDRLRSDFSEIEIDELADSILESNGILRPVVLKQTGVESYAVLDGHLEYFASVRAREKNPQQGEMVNAFVVAAKDEAIAQKQIQALRKTGESAEVQTTKSSGSKDQSSVWISSFETRFSEFREEFFQTKREHEYRFGQLEKNLEKSKGDLLDFLNTSDNQKLLTELPRYGVSQVKIIEAIYEARSQKQNNKFDTYQDVVKATKGFGAEGMLKLIDAWARANKS
jgi:hypothetical protein